MRDGVNCSSWFSPFHYRCFNLHYHRLLNLVIISFFTYLFPFFLFFSWNRLKRSKSNPSPNLAQKNLKKSPPKNYFFSEEERRSSCFSNLLLLKPTYRYLNRRWVDKAAVGLQRNVAARSPQNFKAPVRRL